MSDPDTITYTNPDTGNLITLSGFTSYAEGAKAAIVMLAHLETQAKITERESGGGILLETAKILTGEGFDVSFEGGCLSCNAPRAAFDQALLKASRPSDGAQPQ